MYKAKLLIIQCIDLRFQKIIDKDVTKSTPYGQFDRIAWPGASKDIEALKGAASVSLRLHDPDELIIYEHEDCGAYGDDNSTNSHHQNAKKLSEELKKIKPSLKVDLKLATFNGIKELQSK